MIFNYLYMNKGPNQPESIHIAQNLNEPQLLFYRGVGSPLLLNYRIAAGFLFVVEQGRLDGGYRLRIMVLLIERLATTTIPI